jgi:hypothetical protein
MALPGPDGTPGDAGPLKLLRAGRARKVSGGFAEELVGVLSLRIGAALLAVGGVGVLVLLEHVTAQPRSPLAELSPDHGTQLKHTRHQR